ncbi:hypothetical protein NSK_006853 [Nannochloropsis salina CCMP1776]|uniref:Serine acetyltransferase N-terminal domain-containing protein n=1 Tax=Nannochloropsis salina CCMP1776 TaxID=1027361 RepID=A0A4D9CQZ2_9STRA|nr:hypothetical protein NSK_006853 [Nannochloropsis salina CCMP1776]|eukprot:TFJ81602.1 hypothetical protein NSK_006853 [Nannochloropsis salina CCMP1776]
MHVLFMTRSRGGMGKGGQEQGEPEGKGGGEGGGRGEGVWAQNPALTGKNSSSSVGSPSLLASDLAFGGVAGNSLGPVAKTLAGSSQSHASPSSVPSSPSSPSSAHFSKTLAAQQRRQKAKDQRIFKKIVDSQTTAAVPLHLGGRGREEEDVIWGEMKRDAEMECRKEPLLVSYMYCSILNHKSLEQAVAFHMATKLATPSLIGTQIESLFAQCFERMPSLLEATDKGMKLEWATVKDDKLVLGSFGKAYTAPDGTVLNSNNLWVNVLDPTGAIERQDWKDNYEKIRKALGADDPGYVIHEAACWSPLRREWIFLPRRVSSLPYDEELDEKMGSNKLVIADESFSKLQVRDVGKITPERGFSSFKFLPGSRDTVILALKSVEEAATGKQGTYITLFDIDGEVLLEETPVPGRLVCPSSISPKAQEKETP